jgi:uncharacterized protein
MPVILAAFSCGLVFGWGLQLSGMTDPSKIFGFLDLFGAWDPSLAVVMAAALVVASLGYLLAKRQEKPILAAKSLWPTRTEIDRSLVAGALLFGIGWGLVGLCPGPSIVNLASLSPRVGGFVVAMALGMIACDLWHSRSPRTA